MTDEIEPILAINAQRRHRQVVVETFNLRSSSRAEDFLSTLRRAVEQIPAEHRLSALVEFDRDECDLDVSYWRKETDGEVIRRLESDQQNAMALAKEEIAKQEPRLPNTD